VSSQIKSKPGSTVKVAGKGHVVMRMQLGFSIPDSEKKTLTAADFGITEEAGGNNAPAPSAEAEKGGSTGPNANLFADSYVPSFFRCGESKLRTIYSCC
jgi:hypothetical protein